MCNACEHALAYVRGVGRGSRVAGQGGAPAQRPNTLINQAPRHPSSQPALQGGWVGSSSRPRNYLQGLVPQIMTWYFPILERLNIV